MRVLTYMHIACELSLVWKADHPYWVITVTSSTLTWLLELPGLAESNTFLFHPAPNSGLCCMNLRFHAT